MRRSLALLAIVLLASCDKAPVREMRSPSPVITTEESSATTSGPDVALSTAPDVAFNYRYAFRLPAERVSAVQEEHAQACERLGLNRCRITGLRYHPVNKNDVEAMLAFKLDPAIARQFGKDGAAAVSRADGVVIDTEISGVNAGAAIRQANRTVAQLTDELTKVEARLARKGLSEEERDRLESRAEELRRSIRAGRDERRDQEESLATTPMVFNYGSGDLVPGFDTRSPIRYALEQARDNFVGGISLLFVIFVTVLPWALLGAFVFWCVRAARGRFFRAPIAAADAAP